jgi:PhnB protein
MTTLTTYLLFDGKCAQAMEFYKTCLGGDLTVSKVGESPAKDFMPAAMHPKVIYARLKGENVDLSSSDWLMPNRTPVRGNTVCLFLGGGTKQELKGLFDKLSDGADVTDPLKDVFHGLYGALNDKFGVRWMFQTSSKE